MNDYKNWQDRTLPVTDLLLDSQNPRIPYSEDTATQRQILAVLVEDYKVHELARSIAEQGFYPNELLIGTKDGTRRIIIIEGNRRLAALKLLLSPESAPENWVSRFRPLHAQISLDSIKSVRVTVAPSREAAAPLIISRHTQPGAAQWERVQQARYYRALMHSVGDSLDLEDFAERFGIQKSALRKSLRTETMYQVACNLELPEEIHKVVTSPKFNYSLLERLFETSQTSKALGFSFNKCGDIVGRINPAEFKRGFSRIVKDIATQAINTRRLNSGEDIQGYLNHELNGDKPDLTQRGEFTTQTLLSAHEGNATPLLKARAIPKDPVSKSSSSIIPVGIKCALSNTRVKAVFTELKRTKLATHPSTTGVMFRVLLELVVANYMDKSGKMKAMLASHKFRDKKPDWCPTLTDMLRELLNDSGFPISPFARRSLEKAVNDSSHLLSIDRINQFLHNPYTEPSERELRACWNMMEPIIIPLLTDPLPSGSAERNN